MPDTAVADISFSSLDDGLSAAREARAQGDLTAALRIYAAMRSAWPDSPLPYQRAASALVDSANHDEADVLLEAAMERFPSVMGVAVDHAWVAHRRRDTTEAVRRWRQVRSRFPDHPAGYTGGSATLRDAGRLHDAEALLSEARSRFPDDPAPMAELAWLAAATHDWKLAIERWETMRRRFPDFSPAYTGGIAAFRGARRLPEAEHLASVAMQRFPDEAMVLIEYATVAAARREWPEALTRWELAARKAVGRLEVYRGRALALREQQRFDEADAMLGEAMERFPAAASLAIDRAWIAHIRRDWPQAIVRWHEVRRQFPQQATGFTSGAIALRETGRFDEAEALLTHAVQRFPDLLQPFHDLARLAQMRGDWPEAERRWTQIRQRAPDDPVACQGEAVSLREQGRLAEAEALLVEATTRFPQHADLLIELGWLLNRRRDLTTACLIWERVRQIFPDQVTGYTGGAVALRDLRRFEEAETLLREALRRFANVADPLIELAWVAQFRGDQAAARTAFREALDRFSPQPVAIFGLARVATSLGQFEAAEAHLREGLAAFPGFRLFTTELEALPERRREWAERQAPTAQAGANRGDVAYRKASQADASQTDADQPGILQLPTLTRPDPDRLDLAARDLLVRFESLGGFRFGAELGMIQRACGAEPQSLLRWADLPFEGLLAALKQRFAGFGASGNTELLVAPRTDGGQEYCLRDPRFTMTSRCFVDEADIPAEQMTQAIRRQTSFLAGKLVKALESGSHIFVYRLTDRHPTQPELTRLCDAISAYGEASLLLVCHADETHTAGSVVLAGPGLLVGYIDTSGATRSDEPAALPVDAWVTLLRNAEATLSSAGSAAGVRLSSEAPTTTPADGATIPAAGIAAPNQLLPVIARVSDIKVVFAGYHMSAQIGQILSRSPALRGRLSIYRVDPGSTIDGIRGQLPDRWLEAADIYFEESMVGDAKTRRDIRDLLPARCEARSYPTPTMRLLWPFLGADDRLVHEPPNYHGGRYPNADRIGARLSGLQGMTDDALFDAYMTETADSALDLDADLAADVARWEADDSRHDVKLMQVMRDGFREQRVFVAPHERGSPVIRSIVMQLLETPTLLDVFDLDKARASIDHITRNWSASRQELPVHPRVAAHFGLRWWSPDLLYRLHGNRFTFRDYIIRYIRWSPWMS